MKQKKSILFVLLVLVVNLVFPLINIRDVFATEKVISSGTLIDTDGLEVNYQVKDSKDKRAWILDYASTSKENESQRLKFEFVSNEKEMSFQQKSGWEKDGNWFVQIDFLDQSTGTAKVVTDKSVTETFLRIQSDKAILNDEGEQELITNSLSTKVEGPHKIMVTQVEEDLDEIELDNETAVDDEVVTTESENTNQNIEESVEETKLNSSTDSMNNVNVNDENVGVESKNLATKNHLVTKNSSDSFEYTPDGGQYPTHGTNQYATSSSSDMVKNYDYADEIDTYSNINIQNILDGDLNFDNGYHSYDVGNEEHINLKKVVIPTDDPTQFQIQLDMIGGSLKTGKNVDVAFVVDKSGSMNNNNRWTNLKSSLDTFAHELLDDNPGGAIQLGLASFSSVPERIIFWTVNVPYGKIGNFGGRQGNYTGFTANANAFLSHALLNEVPSGGTPTFLGLDAGLELLTNDQYNGREDAEKVLIILTDGEPTWGPTDNYTSNSAGIRQSRMTRTSDNNGRVETFKASSSNLYNGNGTEMTSAIKNGTISHGEKRIAQNPEINSYAIGFGVSGVDDVLNALGPAGKYLATSKDDLDEVLNEIKLKIQSVNTLIRNADVFDPMSEYVTLDTSSVQKQALTLKTSSPKSLSVTTGTQPEYVNNVTVNTNDNSVNLSNLTLSGNDTERSGLRLTYTVVLKEEYQDGKFYPANGSTYLVDTQYTNPFSFAIPSVKVPPQKIDIEVEKVWDDEDNQWETRKDIVLQLQKKTSDNDWSDVSDETVTIKAGATGEKLKHKFTNLPTYDESRNVIDYRVIEERVNGYENPTYIPDSVNVNSDKKLLQVTNKLLKVPFEFTKVGHDGKTPLVGAGFTLFKADGKTPISDEVITDDTGKIVFDVDAPIGSYLLKEITTPLGYQASDPIEITVSDEDGALIITGLGNGNRVINYLKDFELHVIKKDNNGKNLTGAKFKLESKDGSYSEELGSSDHLFIFEGLQPGEYELIETVTPDGYVRVKEPIQIIIGKDGQVTIDGEKQEDIISHEGNIIHMNVLNQQKGLLPSTGGQGDQHFLFASIAILAVLGIVSIYYAYHNRKELNGDEE